MIICVVKFFSPVYNWYRCRMIGEEKEKMEIKLIAIDMDGTLLRSDGTLSDKIKNTLIKTIEKGILVVPASGRMKTGLPDFITSLSGIQYALTSNGAAVYRLNQEEPLYERTINKKEALQIYDFLAEYDLIIEVYIQGKGYIRQKDFDQLDRFRISEGYKKTCRSKKIPVDNLRKWIDCADRGVEKFNIPWISTELREKVISLTKEMGTISYTHSLDSNIELNSAGTNKGDGLQALCRILEIPLSQVMAIGDNDNDLEMLQEAGIGVAMGNAEQSIQKAADFVTKTNDEDGVAFAIEQWVD